MAKNKAQQAAIAISMKKRGKKPKKVKKKRISKYAPGGMGANYGQVEYGPNILEVPGADQVMKIYLDQNQKIFANNINKLEENQEEYVNYLNQINDAENKQNLSEGTTRLLDKFRKTEGKGLREKAENLFNPPDASTFLESYNPGGEAFSGIAPKGTTAIQYADGSQASLLPGEVIPEGATALGNAAPNALTQATTNFATNTAVGSTAANIGSTINPYALPAYVVGEGINYFADDDDPTTWTGGEIAGDILSTTGKRTGQGALIGSIAGPPGQAIGATVGAIVGFGESIFKGLRDRNDAREQEQEMRDERNALYNEYLTKRRRDLSGMGPNRSLYGTRYMAKAGGIKPMNNQGDMVVYGPTHEQGGVMRDANTELEGGGMKDGVALPGEVITNVKDSQGNTREYYFSDHLKNPSTGNTFAEDYRKSGGMNYNAKQMFAKLQEQVAGRTDKDRSPQTIAKNGGMGERLEEVSKQLTKASKMHAAQSKTTASMAKQLMKKAKGGYKMYDEGGANDDTPAATVNLPEVTVTDRRKRSELEKSLRGLQREIDFLNEGVLSRTPLGGDTGAETLINIASMNPLGLGRLGVLNTGKYLRKIAQPFRDAMAYTNIGKKGKAGKEVVDKAIPSFDDISKTIRVPSTGGTGTNVGPGSVLLPRGGTTTKRMVTTGPDGKKQIVEYAGDFLPATIRSQRTRTKAKDVLDKIRKFTKANKTDITLLSSMGGALAYDAASEPDASVKSMEDFNQLLLNTIQNNVTTQRDTSDLSSAQNFIMKSLQKGEMNYPEVKHLQDNPLQLQTVIDSVKEAQGFQDGGLQPPTKPRDYRFNQPMPNRFDRSMQANIYRSQYDKYLKELEAYNAQMNTQDSLINPITTPTTLTSDLSLSQDTLPPPTFGIRTAEQAEDLSAAKAKTPEEIAGMSDEELDAYINATALDPFNVNIGQVVVEDESNETRDKRLEMEAKRRQLEEDVKRLQANPVNPISAGPIARDMTISGLQMPVLSEGMKNVLSSDTSSKMDTYMRNVLDESDNNQSNVTTQKDNTKKKKKPKTKVTDEGGEGLDIKGLLSKVGLDEVKPLDVLGVAAAGLGFAKANKLAKEMGDLELDIKGDIEVKNIPKQTISLQSEKDKLQQDTNALVNEMTRQGKSTAEIAAIRAQGDEAMRKLGQTENNLQSQMDLKTDALNATNDFKKNAANKQVDLSKALADLDISAAEKRNRMNIWNKLTNEVIGMGLDKAKLKSVEKQMSTLADSMASGNEAMMKTLMEEIKKLIKE